MQVLYDFKDRSALKLTIAQYLTPGDVSIQSVGIQPDIVVNPIMIKKDRSGFRTQSKPEKKTSTIISRSSIVLMRKRKATFTIDHVQNEETEDKDPEPDELADQFQTDYEIDLAQRLLSTSGDTARDA